MHVLHTPDSPFTKDTTTEFILTTLQAGIGEWDLQSGEIHASAELTAVHGLEPGSFPRTLAAYQRCVHPEDWEHVLQTTEQALEQRSELYLEFRIIRPDGQIRWVESKGKLECDQQGQPVRMLCLCLDITARKCAEQERDRLQRQGQRAEAAAHLAEQRYRDLVNGLQAIVWEAEGDACQFTFISRQAEELLGYPITRWLDEQSFWADHIHPEDRERVVALRLESAAAGRDHDAEYRLLGADGRVIWVRDRVRVSFAFSEVPQAGPRLRGVMVDITDQNRMEEELRSTSQSFQTLIQASPAAIIALDTAGAVTRWNPAAERIFGWSEQEVLGRPHPLIPPQAWDQYQHQLGRTLSGQVAVDLDVQRRRKDGVLLDVSISAGPLCDPHGNWSGSLAVLTDITARKRLERINTAFQELGRELNQVSTSEQVAHLILSAADRLLGWDACWLQLRGSAGLDEIQLLMDTMGGQRVTCPPPNSDLLATPLARKALSEGPQLLLREPDQAPQGSIPFGDVSRPCLSLLTVPFRSGEQALGALSVQSYQYQAYTQDDLRVLTGLADYCVTALERTQSEAARQRSEEQLRQAQKMEAIGRLAGGVAHDFNNLLGVITGYVELLLLRPELGSDVRLALEEIQKAGWSAAGLTRQLLTFSRKEIIRPEPLQLDEVLQRLDGMLRRLIGEDICYSVTYAADLPPVLADASQVEQLILNLVLNARDAMPRGGRLSVALHRGAEQRAVVLEVVDTGEGIDAELLPYLFEPFFTTKPVGQGTGLGLATVYGIVTQLEGEIEVTSQPGQGATFRVTLPACREPQKSERTPTTPTPAGREHGTILVVEDEPALRELVRLTLESQGYRVVAVGDAAAALAHLEREAEVVDLLLTDLVMPGTRGVDLAEKVIASFPEISVLCVSGYPDDELLRRGIELHRWEFLPKPFGAAALSRKVGELLDRKREFRPVVMVVDDEAATRESLAEILDAENFRPVVAASGAHALTLLRAGLQPALIISDLVMADGSGWALGAELQQHPQWSHLPVVVCSGQADVRVAGALLGAAATFTKPIEVEQLLRTVRQILETGRTG